jgi:hypothetical protein
MEASHLEGEVNFQGIEVDEEVSRLAVEGELV